MRDIAQTCLLLQMQWQFHLHVQFANRSPVLTSIHKYEYASVWACNNIPWLIFFNLWFSPSAILNFPKYSLQYARNSSTDKSLIDFLARGDTSGSGSLSSDDSILLRLASIASDRQKIFQRAHPKSEEIVGAKEKNLAVFLAELAGIQEHHVIAGCSVRNCCIGFHSCACFGAKAIQESSAETQCHSCAQRFKIGDWLQICAIKDIWRS